MKALVIGGTGYVGGHIASRLDALGFEVTVFARGRTERDLPARIVSVQGNRHSIPDLRALARRGFDAVVDVCAYRREDTQAAVDAFDGRVSRFVHISSLSVNRLTSGFPLRETDPLVTDPETGYAYNKAECERALHQAHARNDFPFVIFRPVVIFGPNDRISRENYYIKRILAGDLVILPDGGLTVTHGIYVRDLADAVARAIVSEEAAGRTYHLMMLERFSLAEHVASIARLLDREVETVAIPSRLLERAGFNLNWFPYYSGQQSIYLDTSAVEKDLELRFTPYKDAIEETVSYFVQNGSESLPTIEDRFPPVIARVRQNAFARQFADRMEALEAEMLAVSARPSERE